MTTETLTIEEVTELVAIRADACALFVRSDEAGLSDERDQALVIMDVIDARLGVVL